MSARNENNICFRINFVLSELEALRDDLDAFPETPPCDVRIDKNKFYSCGCFGPGTKEEFEKYCLGCREHARFLLKKLDF